METSAEPKICLEGQIDDSGIARSGGQRRPRVLGGDGPADGAVGPREQEGGEEGEGGGEGDEERGGAGTGEDEEEGAEEADDDGDGAAEAFKAVGVVVGFSGKCDRAGEEAATDVPLDEAHEQEGEEDDGEEEGTGESGDPNGEELDEEDERDRGGDHEGQEETLAGGVVPEPQGGHKAESLGAIEQGAAGGEGSVEAHGGPLIACRRRNSRSSST